MTPADYIITVEPGASFMSEESGILDSQGKAIGSNRASVTLLNTIISRCHTAGEFINSEVQVHGLHVMEVNKRKTGNRFYDAMYFYGNPESKEPSQINNSVFVGGANNGIQVRHSNLKITSTIIEGFNQSGLLILAQSEVVIEGSIIKGC